MSANAFAQNGSTTISHELDYKPVEYSCPNYRFSKILPLSGSQTVTLGAASTQETILEIPTKAFNLANSVLSWDRTIALVGGRSIWTPEDTCGEILQIQFYSRSALNLVDLNYCNNYLKVVGKKEKSFHSFMTNDVTDPLYRSDDLKVANYTPTANLGSVASGASVNYNECKYLSSTALGAAQTARRMRLRLGDLYNTLFSVDKDLLFPEVMILRIVWSSSKIGWTSLSQTDPSATPLDLPAGATLNNVALYLATESRPEIERGLQAKVASGMEVLIPYVSTYKLNLAGTSQTVSIRLNRANGLFCRKIIHAVFNNAENVNTMYDHTNLDAAVATTAGKVQSYYTAIDNQRIQNYDLSTSILVQDDYMYHKKQLEGSCILNQQMYQLNWFNCDDMLGSESVADGKLSPNLIGGLDLTIDRKWDFVGQSMINANYNHYTFVVLTRKLVISPTSISFL